MYRRNISHLLYMATGIFGLFIVYESWLEPVYVRPPSSALTGNESSINKEPAPEPRADKLVDPTPKQSRLIDTGNLPGTKSQEDLAMIRNEIEKGNVKEAEGKLMSLSPAMHSDPLVRPYVAILWNNLGIEQETHHGTKVSIHAFKKAAALDANNPVIQMNLAHVYWEQRDPAMTTEYLERLITLAPNEPFPHLAIADLLQERDRLREAADHLDQAIKHAGNDPSTQSYLRTVSAKIRRTEQAEGRLNSRASAHFTVKYDGDADEDTWTVVLEILEEAYREIGQQLGHFPSKPIVVVLHSKRTFQTITGSPAWADGLFDPVLGRVQIPTRGALTDHAWLKRVLRHEFVHALIRDLQGLNATAVPTWLNEGLALQLSNDHWSELEQLRQGTVPAIPLPALEGSWGELSSEAATVAYLEADSAARYLIDRYGMYEIRLLLARLRQKQPLSAAMQAQLSLSYDQLQSLWLEQLQEERKKG